MYFLGWSRKLKKVMFVKVPELSLQITSDQVSVGWQDWL